VEGLIQILEYFPDKLKVNDITPEQKKFVLAALNSVSRNIDSFLSLMPADEVGLSLSLTLTLALALALALILALTRTRTLALALILALTLTLALALTLTLTLTRTLTRTRTRTHTLTPVTRRRAHHLRRALRDRRLPLRAPRRGPRDQILTK